MRQPPRFFLPALALATAGFLLWCAPARAETPLPPLLVAYTAETQGEYKPCPS